MDLAFFSGNEVYWKTRWEPSTADGGSTDHRTLVSYKEGDAQGSAEHYDCFGNFACDPDPDTWTGLWRQNQTGHDGGRPENALSGQISWGDTTTAIQVPASATGLRFWRNTGMSGNTTLTAGTLGYEFDWEQSAYAASNPPGRITVSDTTAVGKNHKMSLYRAAPSGALVFGAGTVQWSWGLDGVHDRGGSTEDPRMQQATVNLLSDMGAQPVTLQAGLVPGGALDSTAPTTAITDPTGGATVPGGNVTISGTAADVGGAVAAVEVSTDGGTTWDRATRHDELDLHLQRVQRPGDRAGARHRRRGQHRHGGRRQLQRRGAGLPVLHLHACHDRRSGERRRRRRARRQVPIRCRGLHHRDPLLQDDRQHGYAHRHPLVDCPRPRKPGDRDLHR